MKEVIAKEMKLLRIEKGYTLEKASEITGIAQSTLSAYENCNRLMYIDYIIQIVNSYGCSMYIFFERCIAKMQQNNGEE